MSLPDNFVIVDGLLTVEAILRPSYLVRRRIDDSSLTSPYVWIATIASVSDNEYEIKGHLAKDAYPMAGSERRALKRIVTELKFTSGSYERCDVNGKKRAAHRFTQDGIKIQES